MDEFRVWRLLGRFGGLGLVRGPVNICFHIEKFIGSHPRFWLCSSGTQALADLLRKDLAVSAFDIGLDTLHKRSPVSGKFAGDLLGERGQTLLLKGPIRETLCQWQPDI